MKITKKEGEKMYKDYRKPEREIDIEIDVLSYETTCCGCPTIIEFKDEEGTNYYFRLRHGYAKIKCEDTDETLVEDDMPGFDGVCGFEEMQKWALKKGVKINY